MSIIVSEQKENVICLITAMFKKGGGSAFADVSSGANHGAILSRKDTLSFSN